MNEVRFHDGTSLSEFAGADDITEEMVQQATDELSGEAETEEQTKQGEQDTEERNDAWMKGDELKDDDAEKELEETPEAAQDDAKAGEPEDDAENLKNFIANQNGDINKVARQAINHQKLATYRMNLVNSQEKIIQELQSTIETLNAAKANGQPNGIKETPDSGAPTYEDMVLMEQSEFETTLEKMVNDKVAALQASQSQQSTGQQQIAANDNETEIIEHNANLYMTEAKEVILNEAILLGDKAAIERLSANDYQVTNDEWNKAVPHLRMLQSQLMAQSGGTLRKFSAADMEYAKFKLNGSTLPSKADILASQPTRKPLDPNSRRPNTAVDKIDFDKMGYEGTKKYLEDTPLDKLNEIIDSII